jgi:nitroimidazol reductase NimA-like FMN-containing flavoprotein (pyridoxamine 5'-phosphate oxidase superfamily)
MTATSNSPEFYPTAERTRIRRLHERGSHGREDVHRILDEAPLCHVGYVIDGNPYVTPTVHWRVGERVYWHGSSASRFLRKALGTQVCITCSFMDGYVLSRSAYFHSARYRSAMVFGTAQMVEGDDRKIEALHEFIQNLFPGRWDSLRPMQPQELKATTILYVDIEEATAKVRGGFPNDPDDVQHPVWAGAVPIVQKTVEPENAPDLIPGLEVPDYVTALVRSGGLRTPPAPSK